MTALRKKSHFADLVFRFFDSDIFYSFRTSPVTVISFIITILIFIAAAFAPWLAPHDSFDPASVDLMNAYTPPVWTEDGVREFLLGTDDQIGRAHV